MKKIKIGNRLVGDDESVFIIAESGVNHNGMLHVAKSLVDVAVSAGVDAVKFQKRNLVEIYRKEFLCDRTKGEQSIQYLLPLLEEFELNDSEFIELIRYCDTKDITFLCTPWDEKSAGFLGKMGVSAFKVSSADMTNFILLESLAKYKKPLIVSTGMSTVKEIDNTVKFLRNLNLEFILMHCNSSYPAPFHNLNLNFIKVLKEKYDVPIGYSGHELGIAASEAAVVLGANIIERHLTIDRTMRGPDHAASLEPQGLIKLTRDIRNIEKALGAHTRWITRGEYINREFLGKSLVAKCDIKKNKKITRKMITAKSPGTGLSPQILYGLVGRKTIRNIPKDTEFKDIDLTGISFKGEKIKLSKKWGIIVRLTDIDILYNGDLEILELRFTDNDLGLKKRLKRYNQELVVHTPEYYGDHLLDPASLDSRTRNMTIEILDRAFIMARKLSKRFGGSCGKAVKVIIHPGGMSRDILNKKEEFYNNLESSLKHLNKDGIEILLENMPPLPWYFGGQWFHNIFVLPEEILKFCQNSGYALCFDISHAFLASNYYSKNFGHFLNLIELSKHLHLSDAAGIDGEGLQIGEGDIDFSTISPQIKNYKYGIVPEIWQGHKFRGAGYWKAINIFESLIRK